MITLFGVKRLSSSWVALPEPIGPLISRDANRPSHSLSREPMVFGIAGGWSAIRKLAVAEDA